MENKETLLKKIGANIRDIRKLKKKESKDAAKGLGISVQAYGKIENGGTDLNISRVFEIAKFFDVSFTQVLKVNEGDVFNYSSQNNSGGYHVQTIGVLNVTDETLKNYFENDIAQLKEKIIFFEGALKKGK
jgi:transcriptional regulator with XRE-family HTH domain